MSIFNTQRNKQHFESKGESKPPSTSWQNVSNWYNKEVGQSGHYYHQHIVLPKVLSLLNLQPTDSLLDIGCGQGVLERAIPPTTEYAGVDSSASLIETAMRMSKNPKHEFKVGDATHFLRFPVEHYTHAALILSLQNMKNGEAAIKNTAKHLQVGGVAVIVLNHPCFRIPRQSSWGVDAEHKTQYRRVDRYLSPLEIPIQANPSKRDSSAVTWSYHSALSTYSAWFNQHKLAIMEIQEWSSDKESEGKTAKMENRSRSEFPLFLTFVCRKYSPAE